MPRIPQGEFDQNPSTRVETPNTQLAPDPLNKVGTQLASLANAAAVLQDQSERTDAYSFANQAKQDYLKKKATFVAAAETVNGQGMVDYFDPEDQNPDITKRKRIQRPIHEMYQEMVDGYEGFKKNSSGLHRGDIAQDLMRNYVGDDLIQLQMNTNKRINKVREKEMEWDINENIELNLGAFQDIATDENSTPEQVALAAQKMNNGINRELAYASPVLGADKTKEVQQRLDRAYGTFVDSIIENSPHGITETSATGAQIMLSKIKDPGQRALRTARFEKKIKATSEVQTVSNIGKANGINQKTREAAIVNDSDWTGIVKSAFVTMNSYVDPSNPRLKEEAKLAGADLISTGLAKRMLQDAADSEDFDYLSDASQDFNDASLPVGLRRPGGNWDAASAAKAEVAAKNSPKGIVGSKNLYKFITGREGFSAGGYNDRGFTSSGFGTRAQEGDNGRPLTRGEATKRMQDYVQNAEKELTGAITNEKLTQSQKDVLLDMHYNLGLGGMKGMIDVVNSGDNAAIEAEIGKYTHAPKMDKQGNVVKDANGQPVMEEVDALKERVAARLDMWRDPASQAAMEAELQKSSKTEQLKDNIKKELEASGLSKMLNNTEMESLVQDSVVSKMRQFRRSMKDNVAAAVEAKYANKDGREQIEKIQQIARVQGLGEPSLISPKTREVSLKAIMDELPKSSASARAQFDQVMQRAGDQKDGPSSYRRGLAIDLVGKDEASSFLIPAADAPEGMRNEIFRNASLYKTFTKESDDYSEKKLTKAFESYVPDFDSLAQQSNDTYMGVRQAVMHEAAYQMHENKKDLKSAMTSAADKYRQLYTAVETRYGSALALNVPGGLPYSKSAKTMERGMEMAASLAHLPREEKLRALMKTNVPVSPTTPDSDLDMYLKHMVTLKPDPRYPNMHFMYIGDGKLLDSKRNELKISSEEIYNLGSTSAKEEAKKLQMENAIFSATNKY